MPYEKGNGKTAVIACKETAVATGTVIHSASLLFSLSPL